MADKQHSQIKSLADAMTWLAERGGVVAFERDESSPNLTVCVAACGVCSKKLMKAAMLGQVSDLLGYVITDCVEVIAMDIENNQRNKGTA